MSALGQKQTLPRSNRDVRFTPKSGHCQRIVKGRSPSMCVNRAVMVWLTGWPPVSMIASTRKLATFLRDIVDEIRDQESENIK